MSSDDYGKDLASIENLLKKHQLLEADINAHDDRINEMNAQADSLLESEQFDRSEIENRRKVGVSIFIIFSVVVIKSFIRLRR